MEEEKNENLNSQIEEDEETEEETEETEVETESDEDEETEETEEETEETEALKALKEKNKHLFARVKKAEGFVFKDGKWIKPEAGTKVRITSKKDNSQKIEELIEQKLKMAREQDALEALDFPEDLKSEVKDLASLKGISVREAVKLPLMIARKEQYEQEQRIKNSSPNRKKKGSYLSKIDPSQPLNPQDFDFSNEEGVKAWKEAKAQRNRYLSEQK